MAEFVFKGSLPFPGIKRGQSFGTTAPFQVEAEPAEPTGERLYAFALADRTQPVVHDYNADDEGMQSLANLIRSEDVLAVIRGHRAHFELASVVEVAIGGRTHRDRMPLSGGQ